MSRASAGLSSINSRVRASKAIEILWERQLYNGKPEILDVLHNCYELAHINWLGDIAIGVQRVTHKDVALVIGGCEHHNRNGFQRIICLNHFEQFAPRHA